MRPAQVNTTIIVMFIQYVKLRFVGLYVMLYRSMGSTKSSGINPNAPTTAFISPKKGSMAAMNPQNAIYSVLSIKRGTRLRLENIPFVVSAEFFSIISYATCEYTYQKKNSLNVSHSSHCQYESGKCLIYWKITWTARCVILLSKQPSVRSLDNF